MTDDNIKLIYIAGYGRSGSTIIDTLISQNNKIFSTGALVNIYHWFNKNEQCSCGRGIKDCEFWSKVNAQGIRAVTNECEQVRKKVESLRGFGGLLLNSHTKETKEKYSICMGELYSSIAEISGKNVIVDSSKSARGCTGRPLAIQMYTNIKVKVIFITRDARGVAWSAIKGVGSSERKRIIKNSYFQCIKSSISWSITNLFVLILKKRIQKQNFLQIKYEDLANNPHKQLEKIGNLIDERMDEVVERMDKDGFLEIGHILGGNRLRFNKKLEFKPDLKWKSDMPARFRILCEIVSFPVRKLLNY